MTDDATPMPERSKAPGGTPERQPRIIRLNDEQRRYVVRRLAAGDGLAKIVRDVQARFGIRMSRQGIAYYDPTREAQCGAQWGREYNAARRSLSLAQSHKTIKFARTERLLLQALETLADRILKGVDAEGRKMFAKRPEDISDNDRIRALVAFVRKLKATDPAGFAAIRSEFFDEHEQPATDVVTSPAATGEAHHAG
jgi:hypothetical protein